MNELFQKPNCNFISLDEKLLEEMMLSIVESTITSVMNENLVSDDDKYLTPSEVCQELTISVSSFYRLKEKHNLLYYKIGNIKKYKLKDIKSLVDN